MQFLEVVRLEGLAFSPEDVALAGRDMYLLQVSSLCLVASFYPHFFIYLLMICFLNFFVAAL